MSKQNVELTRRIYQALSSGDAGALVALCDPSIEIHSVFAAVGGAIYHGHDGARRWQRDLQETFGGEFRVEIESYFDIDERTMVVGKLRGRGGQSGADVAMPAAGVARWREGLCVSHKGYASKDDALGDLGVSEDGLERIDP
jgi:ketosteroid isomerase-like protein